MSAPATIGFMSRRTADLPPLTGLPHLIREMRYNEFLRQALGLLLIPLYALLANPWPISFAIGCTIALIGMLIRLYASGFIVKNKQLATNGPYSLVRHPLYTGNLLADDRFHIRVRPVVGPARVCRVLVDLLSGGHQVRRP